MNDQTGPGSSLARDATSRNELVFTALGGLGEIGMNVYLYGLGPPEARRWLMVDLGLTFPAKVPSLRPKHDVWLETVFICRGAFALAQIIAPVRTWPFGSTKKAPFDMVFAGTQGKQLLDDVDRAVLHDAVLNIAVIWKSVWDTFL